MKAALVHDVGALPRSDEVPEPEASDGRSVVRVRAVALNPLDLSVAAGRFYGGHPPLPYVPGSEAVVEHDGRLAWFFGDGAGVARDGTLAELAVVADERLVDLPDGVDPALAAALGIAGIAGWGAAKRARIGTGDRVLVLGATGTAGSVALQAARLAGAERVVAAGRHPERLARARTLGADETVQLDGGDDLAARFKQAAGGDGPTAVLDYLWNGPAVAATEAAVARARLVNVGQSAGPEAPLTSAAVRGKELEVLGFSNFARTPAELRELYLELLARAQEGEIRVDVETFSLDEVDEAWRRQGAGAKAVVLV